MSLRNTLAAGLAATTMACSAAPATSQNKETTEGTNTKFIHGKEVGNCHLDYLEGTKIVGTKQDIDNTCLDINDSITCIFAEKPRTVFPFRCNRDAEITDLKNRLSTSTDFECVNFALPNKVTDAVGGLACP